MRLIDADELMSLYEGEDENLKVSLRVVKQNIKDMPTIDAEPIVRCKDCKHRGKLECRFGITVFNAPKFNDYCSYGERREVENG